MANSNQARKRARQSEVRRKHNASLRSTMRTHIKKVLKAIDAGDKGQAEEAYKATAPFIDRMANKGIIARNKAARQKSRLNAKVKALS